MIQFMYKWSICIEHLLINQFKNTVLHIHHKSKKSRFYNHLFSLQNSSIYSKITIIKFSFRSRARTPDILLVAEIIAT